MNFKIFGLMACFPFSACITTQRLVISKCDTVDYRDQKWMCNRGTASREMDESERKVFELDKKKMRDIDPGTGYQIGSYHFARRRLSQETRQCADENFARGGRENMVYKATFLVSVDGKPDQDVVADVQPPTSYVIDCVSKKIRASKWPVSNRKDTSTVLVTIEGLWYLR